MVKTKMRMLMVESEQLQSSLRIRRGTDTRLVHIVFFNILYTTGQKDTLEDAKQEIEVLQDSISSVSVQLLPSSMCHTLHN